MPSSKFITRLSFSLCLAACVPFTVAASEISVAGVPNFHKIDDHVYRGAQPSDEGFKNLASLGVKTVIDLRGSEHSEADENRVVEAAGMRYVSIPMKGMTTPTDEQVAAALALMNDTRTGPVFVHCKRGADRTGAIVACYRIGHDHWDAAKSLNEARNLGMSWYQLALQKYVSGYDRSHHQEPTMAGMPTPAPATGASE